MQPQCHTDEEPIAPRGSSAKMPITSKQATCDQLSTASRATTLTCMLISMKFALSSLPFAPPPNTVLKPTGSQTDLQCDMKTVQFIPIFTATTPQVFPTTAALLSTELKPQLPVLCRLKSVLVI